MTDSVPPLSIYDEAWTRFTLATPLATPEDRPAFHRVVGEEARHIAETCTQEAGQTSYETAVNRVIRWYRGSPADTPLELNYRAFAAFAANHVPAAVWAVALSHAHALLHATCPRCREVIKPGDGHAMRVTRSMSCPLMKPKKPALPDV